MRDTITVDNNIRSKRPDIAQLMDAYNKHHCVVNNNPDKLSLHSTKMIHCRCRHGHDFSRSADKMQKLSVDKDGIVCCPTCLSEGLQHRAGSVSIFDFANSSPDKAYLLDVWDYEKNAPLGITPRNITTGLAKKVWWKCNKGHSYLMAVFRKTGGAGCPVCSGALFVSGENDLLSQYPEVAKDWDYDKNPMRPENVARHTPQRVYWKCHKCGHEWQTSICSRTSERFPGQCPKCINHGMSRMEMCIYLAVKKYFPDAQYRAKINKTEFDVFIPSINFVIEYDGIYFHRDLKRKELHKDVIAQQNGLKFFRIAEVDDIETDFLFNNNILQIHTNYNTKYIEICSLILQHMRDDFNIVVDVLVDEDIVYQAFSEMNTITTNNSLATKYPAIAKEWHPTKNGNLKPEYIDYSSHVKAWWVCSKCGNEFQKSVGGRTSVTKKQVGCAFCTGQRRRVGFNDLETLYPGIKQFWCEKENIEIGMFFEECAPTSVKYTYWNFGEGIKKMQIRNAIKRYETIQKYKK